MKAMEATNDWKEFTVSGTSENKICSKELFEMEIEARTAFKRRMEKDGYTIIRDFNYDMKIIYKLKGHPRTEGATYHHTWTAWLKK